MARASSALALGSGALLLEAALELLLDELDEPDEPDEPDELEVVDADDDADEETKALLRRIVEEEEAARAEELENERLSLSLLEEE